MADGIMKHLRQDVVIYILLRIPLKFLLRFKCVSKFCYSLIKSSRFINLHLNRTTTAKDEFILFKRSFKEDICQYKTILSFLSCESDDYLNPICPDLDVPTMTSTLSIDYDQLIGPCRGLIALMDNVKTVLLNPSTRNYRLLPPYPYSCPRGFFRSIKCVGFGFDSICDDYKVIRISEYHKDDRFGYPLEEEERVEVYDLSTDSWRELHHADLQFPVMHWLPCSQLFYEGVCHWIALREILCFDVSTEIFSSIEIPDTHDNSSGSLYSFAILRKSLTLVGYPYKVPSIDPTKDFTDIWIIKDYNIHKYWIKIFSIRGLTIGTPLAIWTDHLLLFQGISGCLMSYDLNSSEVKEYILHGCRQSMRVIVYKENLISIPIASGDKAEDQYCF